MNLQVNPKGTPEELRPFQGNCKATGPNLEALEAKDPV